MQESHWPDIAHFAGHVQQQVALARWFTLHELGGASSLIELQPAGSIGHGANQLHQHWQVLAEGKEVVLQLIGQAGPTHKLFLGFDSIWRGKSTFHPSSHLQLIPRDIAARLKPAGFPHYTNLPFELVERLRDRLGLKHFIETGTFEGVTTKLMASRFQHVITIEFAPHIYAQTYSRLAAYPNIRCLMGDSTALLPIVLQEIDGQAVIWLDAHWCGQGTGRCRTECPLLQELDLIYAHRPDHIVLIDDARLFFAPPPPPHQAADWPTFSQICDLLFRQRTMPFVQLLGDVIFLGPQQVGEEVLHYCKQQQATPSDFAPGLPWTQ